MRRKKDNLFHFVGPVNQIKITTHPSKLNELRREAKFEEISSRCSVSMLSEQSQLHLKI